MPAGVLVRVSPVADVGELAGKMAKKLGQGRTIRLAARSPNAIFQMLKVSVEIQQLLAQNGLKVYWRISFTDQQDSSIAMESYVGGA